MLTLDVCHSFFITKHSSDTFHGCELMSPHFLRGRISNSGRVIRAARFKLEGGGNKKCEEIFAYLNEYSHGSVCHNDE